MDTHLFFTSTKTNCMWMTSISDIVVRANLSLVHWLYLLHAVYWPLPALEIHAFEKIVKCQENWALIFVS